MGEDRTDFEAKSHEHLEAGLTLAHSNLVDFILQLAPEDFEIAKTLDHVQRKHIGRTFKVVADFDEASEEALLFLRSTRSPGPSMR